MSKEMIEDCLNWLRRRTADPYELKAADLIEQLQREKEELEFISEQRAMMIEDLQVALATAQARKAKLREALELNGGVYAWCDDMEVLRRIEEAIAQTEVK